MNIKGQTVVELVLLLSISVLALAIIYSLYSSQLELSSASKEVTAAKSTINRIVNSANSLALSGIGSSERILIEIPSDVNMLDSNITGNEIYFRLSSGGEVFGFSDVNLEGQFKKNNGVFVTDGYFMTLTFDGEKVVISYDDFELNTNGIFVSAKQGSTIQKNFTLRNNSSRNAVFWISGDFPFDSFAQLIIDPTDSYFSLSPNETKVIDFNIVLSDFASGNYAGEVSVTGQINDGVSDSNITKNVIVSVESFLNMGSVMIFPKSTSFSSTSSTSTIKSFSLCNSSGENISSIEWVRQSNPDANMLEWFNWPIVNTDGEEIISIPSGDCVYFDLNFTVPVSAVEGVYDANITVTYNDGNTSSAYFFVTLENPLIYSLFFSTLSSTLPANYFLSNFVSQSNDTNYFISSGELDWKKGFELNSSNIFFDSDLIGLWNLNDKNSDLWILNSVTNERDGQLIGGADISSGGMWESNALSLNGSNQYASINSSSSPSEITISAWVNLSGWSNYPGIVAKGYWDGGGESYGLHIRGNYSVWLDVNDSGNRVTYNPTGKVLTLNNWHHVVATVSSTNMQIYIDGVAAGSGLSGDYSIGSTNKPIYFGRLPGFGYFNGLIEDVAIWDYAFTSNQVEDLFDSQKENWLDENLIGYYKLDDANSDLWVLNSATGVRDGQLVGGVNVSSKGLWDSNSAYFYSNPKITTPINNQLNDFTVSVWFRDDTLINSYERLVDKDYANGFWIGRNGSTPNSWGGGIKEGGAPYGIFGTFLDGKWNHLVSIRRGTTHELYANGVLVNSNTVSADPLSTANIIFGNSSSNDAFNGWIDEVKIYNRALSELEVMQDYNSFLSAKFVDSNIVDASGSVNWNLVKINSDVNYSFGREINASEKFGDSLIGLWHLNELNGTEFSDSSGSGNDGSCSSCPSVSNGLWDTNARSFNGSNNFIDLGNSASLSSDTQTISFWLMDKGTDKVAYIYARNWAADTWASLGIVYEGSTLKVCSGQNAGQTVLPYSSIKNGDFFAFVFNYPTCSIYRNGQLLKSLNLGSHFNTGSTYKTSIGRGGEYNNYYFDGKLEEVSVWNRVLSSEEILDLYRKGISRLDLNVYSCSTANCSNKLGSQYISNISNNSSVNLSSSVLNSRYLGFDAYFNKAKGFEDFNADTFIVGSFLKDFNIVFEN